jgi:hypothetical protein
MNTNYKIAAAVIGSFVLGAGTVQILHAQAKPPAYTLAEIAVQDEDGYKKDFLPEAQASSRKAAAYIWLAASTRQLRSVAPRQPIASF